MALQQHVGGRLAQLGVADHDRHDMARRRQQRQSGLGEPGLDAGGALLMAVALNLALLQVADAGERAGGEQRRQ